MFRSTAMFAEVNSKLLLFRVLWPHLNCTHFIFPLFKPFWGFFIYSGPKVKGNKNIIIIIIFSSNGTTHVLLQISQNRILPKLLFPFGWYFKIYFGKLPKHIWSTGSLHYSILSFHWSSDTQFTAWWLLCQCCHTELSRSLKVPTLPPCGTCNCSQSST
jgi:hypothetical protein